MGKKALCLIFAFLLSINSFAAVVSDNDGSAFITKAEFDSLKNDFQNQIDSYNTEIDSKIDAAIASYLVGVTLGSQVTLVNNYNKILNNKTIRWVSASDYSKTNSLGIGMQFIEHKEIYPNGEVIWQGTFSKAKRQNQGRWTFENIYICNHDKTKANVVYVQSQKEIEPKFSEWNFYRFGVFGGYTSSSETTFQLAGRTPEPRWDRISLDKPSNENEYRDDGDLTRYQSHLSYQYVSGSRRYIFNTLLYSCEEKNEYDYLILAPVSTADTYYYWADCHDYITHAGWDTIKWIPPSGAYYTYSLDNQTSARSVTSQGTTYNYRQINFLTASSWTNTIGVGHCDENVPWINCKARQNRLRYQLINDATGEDYEINCGILLTKAKDKGKLTFQVSSNTAGKLVCYASTGVVNNLGTASGSAIKRFDIGTVKSTVTLNVEKDDNIRFVYLPNNTSVQGTLNFESDLILEKTE